jgi:hypothetical protein
VLESSGDNETWLEIDRQTNNNDLRDDPYKAAASFEVTNSLEARYFRLTQTGKNHGGNDRLIIFAFEFFGTLVETGDN